MATRARSAICILGMHRSGTSAVARAVNLLGVDIGHLGRLLPPREDNPEGFWENKKILDFHETLFQDLGCHWYDTAPVPQNWWKQDKVQAYKETLARLIQDEFADAPVWMWKDPRTCILLPIWQEVLQTLGIEVHYLICIRNPLDVAASLMQHHGFPISHGLALWQRYTLSALQWTHDSSRTILHYESLLKSWEPCLKTVMETFGLPWPGNNTQLKTQLDQYLKPQLRHHRSNWEESLHRPEVREETRVCYQLLLETERDPSVIHRDAFRQLTTTLYGGCNGVKQPAKLPAGPDEVAFCQVFWTNDGGYSEETSARLAIVNDNKFHDYTWQLPTNLQDPLRIDPVNCPGAIAIQSIELFSDQERNDTSHQLARWSPQDLPAYITLGPNTMRLDCTDAFRVLAWDDDPQLFLRGLPARQEDQTPGKYSLRISMQVEQNHLPHIRSVLETLDTERIKQAEICSQQDRRVADLQSALAEKTMRVRTLEETLQSYEDDAARQVQQITVLEETVRRKNTAVGTLKDRVAQQGIQVADLQQTIYTQEKDLAALQAQQGTLASQLSAELRLRTDLLNSLSWRLTAPLRYAKAAIRSFRRLSPWRVHRMRFEPIHELVVEAGGFRSTGYDPQFLLHSVKKHWPNQWVVITYWSESKTSPALNPQLFVDCGNGFVSESRFLLPSLDGQGKGRALLCLPDRIDALRLDPLEYPEKFPALNMTIREIGFIQGIAIVFWRLLRHQNFHLGQVFRLVSLAIEVLKRGGVIDLNELLLTQIGEELSFPTEADYQLWIKTYDRLTHSDRAAILRRIDRLSYKPLISVIMPVYNTPERWLRRAIESVRNQLYPYWELCIADDASSKSHIQSLLKQYEAKDSRIKVVFREQNGHIAAASNSALEIASGDFVALLDHDDELAEHALYMAAVELNAHPETDLIYSDEDKLNDKQERYDPYFKPDWNPDLFLSQNFVSHLGIYRTSLVKEVGGFLVGYEGAQDWDLAMRVVERIPPAHIRHIPYVLYHWRAIPGSTALGHQEKDYAITAQEKLLNSHFCRIGVNAKVSPIAEGQWRVRYPLPQDLPLVTLIIPTRNGFELLYRCVESIYKMTTYPNFEILIVDNQSKEPQTLRYLESLKTKRGVTVLHYDAPFNFSAISNFGVRCARGEVIGLLNNDLEVISSDWLSEMVSHAIRPEIGAVGAMLYYPDDTIQHAGVIVGWEGVAGHAHSRSPRGYPGPMGRAQLTQNYSAVTGACLIIRKPVFGEVGGLNEKHLPIAFNDIDFCLRVREKGYWNVWTPHAELYHHESASRGCDDTTEKQARFRKEVDYMQWRWGNSLSKDPTYSPNLAIEKEDFTLACPPRSRKPWRLTTVPHSAPRSS